MNSLRGIYTCLSPSPTGTAGVLSELYFSNNNDIMRLTNGSSTVVIPGLKLVDTIECNICDRMIYWVDQNPPVAIRRALPGNASSVETVSHCVCVCVCVWGGGGGIYQCGVWFIYWLLHVLCQHIHVHTICARVCM